MGNLYSFFLKKKKQPAVYTEQIDSILQDYTDLSDLSIDIISYFYELTPIFVTYFYTTWCPHCIRFKEEWIRFKNNYSHLYIITENDCSKMFPSWNEHLNFLKLYPTILINSCKDSYKIISYEENRTAESIAEACENLSKKCH